MNSLDLRAIVEEHLKGDDRLERVFGLGNSVYVHVGEVEFEIVVRTARPEWFSDRIKKQDGPVTQE
jgi:hypothetical protein